MQVELEVESKRLDYNLCQFHEFFSPTTTDKSYINAKPRVLKVVILKLDSILRQLNAFGFEKPESLFRFGQALTSVGHVSLPTVASVIHAFAYEIENLKALDRNEPHADLERARKFSLKMIAVVTRLNLDAQARLCVAVAN
jgi:hypothetical protein